MERSLRVLALLVCAHGIVLSAEHSWIRPASTGTTIVGCVYDGGVVLGADTRATRHTAISNKRTKKIHRISNHIYCCGAGVAADAAQIAAKLRKHVYKLQVAEQVHHNHNRNQHQNLQVGVSTAAAAAAEYLTDNKHRFEVGVILGGMDPGDGGIPRLFQFSNEFPCGIAVHSCAMGSGMLAANAVLDSFHARNRIDTAGRRRVVLPSKEEAMNVVSKAVLAGIHNDLGSGSNVDICVINANGATVMEPFIASPAITAASRSRVQERLRDDTNHDATKKLGADIGELVCSRKFAVKKLLFSEDGAAQLRQDTTNNAATGMPFASII